MNSNNLKQHDIDDILWESKFPLQIELSKDDITSEMSPTILYFLFPRMGYLCSIIIEIKQFLEKQNIETKLSDIWLEYKNIPLKWHLPFGIIYDFLNMKENPGLIPITIHVKDFPTGTLIKYENLDSLRFYFINSLKEANIIKFPNDQMADKLNNSVIDSIKKIIMSYSSSMRSEYRQVMNIINKNDSYETYDRFPVKIIIEMDKMILTKALKIKKEEYQGLTMESYLTLAFKKATYDALIKKCDFIIQGLDINNEKDLAMPFLFYYLNFTYLDNYLYIIIRPKMQ